MYKNLLERDFHASHPNLKWVTDMTEVQVEKERFYILALMDLFNREVIALEVSPSPNQELIKATIESARKKKKIKDTLRSINT